MPIYVGNYGSSKILGLTKTSNDQWNIKDDTIFHSSLPYVRVIEHELTSYTLVQDPIWFQSESTGGYWNETDKDGETKAWWCGQSFPLTAQLQNMLQNTTRGFMVFIRWDDGYWEPLMSTLGMESAKLFSFESGPGYTYQQQVDHDNTFRNLYGLSKYSTKIFIPRRKVPGSNKVDPNKLVTKVRVLELVGLDVQQTGAISLTYQNPSQTGQVRIDNTSFIIGSLNIMQEKYLQLMTNYTALTSSTKTHNVQQDMIYPSSVSYTMTTLDLVGENRTLGRGSFTDRNSPPIIQGTKTGGINWNVSPPVSLFQLDLKQRSLTQDWTKIVVASQPSIGGSIIPRLQDPNNQATYITQQQAYRRDDYINRTIGSSQGAGSKVMQVGVLNGVKFGNGVYLDSRRPQIGVGQRELFSPQTNGVARVGPTKLFTIPRVQMLISPDYNDTLYQFHDKVQITSFTLSQQESISNTFLLTLASKYHTTFTSTLHQTLISPPSQSTGSLKRYKTSLQDSQLGYIVLNHTVSDQGMNQQGQGYRPVNSFGGAYLAIEQTRQVHQINLAPGDKFILADLENALIDQGGSPISNTGILLYIERSGNTISIIIETYISNTFNTTQISSLTGYKGIAAGGFSYGLAQVL